MATKKLFISDQRMLRLMEWAMSNKLAGTEKEYLERIGFPRTNISNVRRGIQSFTKEHILKACQFSNTSADYIFGFTNTRSRTRPKRSLDLLKEAVYAIEGDIKQL